jgi:hypothetical protein
MARMGSTDAARRAGLVLVASGDDGTATFLEGNPLKRAQTIPVGADADNVRYDAAQWKVSSVAATSSSTPGPWT